MEADSNIYRLGIKPINSVLSVKQGDVEFIAELDYYFYDGRIEIVKTIDNYRVPLTITLDVGYSVIPDDLKQAFYELINFRFESLNKQTNVIASVDNGQTKTTYRVKPPEHIHCTLMNYSPLNYAYAY